MRKEVKNGFVEVTESPSTHNISIVAVRQWVFTPYMLPDGHPMPRETAAWYAEFERVGEKLEPLTATDPSEFNAVLEKCQELIQEAYDAKYNPKPDAAEQELLRLGFQ